MDDKTREKIRTFNSDALNTLKDICKGIGADKGSIQLYIIYFENEEVYKSKDVKIIEEKTKKISYMNYYGAEYKKNNMAYRITMYYKDFDHGSGNIHVLPGAIQVWKKVNCKHSTYKGFCKKELKKSGSNKSVRYNMYGGIPYCEFDWQPLLDDVIYWEKGNLNNIIAKIKDENYKCISRNINSNTFYKDVIGYASKGRKGHYMRYSLLRFTENELFYKTVFCENEGFFTLYDGIKVGFLCKTNCDDKNTKNEKGPNYYDLKQCKWIISDNQYKEKETNNE